MTRPLSASVSGGCACSIEVAVDDDDDDDNEVLPPAPAPAAEAEEDEDDDELLLEAAAAAPSCASPPLCDDDGGGGGKHSLATYSDIDIVIGTSTSCGTCANRSIRSCVRCSSTTPQFSPTQGSLSSWFFNSWRMKKEKKSKTDRATQAGAVNQTGSKKDGEWGGGIRRTRKKKIPRKGEIEEVALHQRMRELMIGS